MYWKRGPRKIIADYTPNDIYKWYIKNRKNKVEINTKTYHEIVQKFNHLVTRAMIYENMEFIMPGRLGSLRIIRTPYKIKLTKEGKVDTSQLVVNWKKTKELWSKTYPDKTADEIHLITGKKVIYELNEHTDRQKYHFRWCKLTSNVQNKTAYYFEMMRPAKTELAKALKEIPALRNNFYTR